VSRDDESEPPGEPARPLCWLRSRRIRVASALLVGALLLIFGWPLPGGAILFPDSLEYLSWPAAAKETGVTRLGPRMPSYPILLTGVGTGAALVHLQIWLSLVSWALLGWVIAGAPGMLLGGLVSLTPELRFWDYAVLTESLTASLLALLTALGLMLARSWRNPVMALWVVLVCFFGLMRPSNLAILPFLLVPFALQIHDLRSWRPLRSGLRPHGARLLVAVGVVVSVGLAGTVLAERSGFWRMNYYIAMLERVVTDPAAREHFVRAGLPVPVRWKSDEFAVWFEEHARSTYQGWVLGRPESYGEAWRWMAPEGQREALRIRYVEPDGAPLVETPLEPLASRLFDWLAPPEAFWAVVVLLPLALGLSTGRLEVLALWAATLALGTYTQSFLTYHASAAEEMRHTLIASLMYRLSFVFAIASLASRLRRPAGPEEG